MLVGIPLLALPVLRGGAIGARIRNEARKQANFLAQEGEGEPMIFLEHTCIFQLVDYQE